MSGTSSPFSPNASNDSIEPLASESPATDEHVPQHSAEFYANNLAFRAHLRNTSPLFAELTALRDEGWKSAAGDAYFAVKKARAMQYKNKAQGKIQLGMYQRIIENLHRDLGIFDLRSSSRSSSPTTYASSVASSDVSFGFTNLTLRSDIQDSEEPIKILDLCCAPGGFLSVAMDHLPTAQIHGITLPVRLGGFNVLKSSLPKGRSAILQADLTMFAGEFGFTADDIPPEHPDAKLFDFRRPFEGHEYDVVHCDGQVLVTHKRGEHRERYEATRLMNSQLIIALQRLKPGGTLVAVVHKAENWNTVLLLKTLSEISDQVRTWKPTTAFGMHSNFFIVAKGVDRECEKAQRALERWRSLWWQATAGQSPFKDDVGGSEETFREVMEIEERIRKWGEEAWKVQVDALKKTEFIRAAREAGGTALQ
jgi:23S rRNA U2552 (ribose-2'-O)-methylase RlmE/FtsJ